MDFLAVERLSLASERGSVLEQVSFRQDEFEKVVIAGETGSGKSTLLKSIAGLVQPTEGQVLFEGERVQGPEEKLVPGHPGIAYLSQHFELPHSLRVEQALRYANSLPADQAQQLYEICRITHLLQRKTRELSGGERQRIALARLLSTWPSLLLLDEPYSNLDMGHKSTLKAVIRDISDTLGITCLMVSHDPLDSLSWADKVLVLHQGNLLQEGSPQAVYRQPVNAYVAGLFGKYNFVPAAEAKALFNHTVPATGDLLLRPENICIVPFAEASTQATITAIHYFGSYYELEVQTATTPLLLRLAPGHSHAIGDTVGVKVVR